MSAALQSADEDNGDGEATEEPYFNHQDYTKDFIPATPQTHAILIICPMYLSCLIMRVKSRSLPVYCHPFIMSVISVTLRCPWAIEDWSEYVVFGRKVVMDKTVWKMKGARVHQLQSRAYGESHF
jgi:hypothetical protein